MTYHPTIDRNILEDPRHLREVLGSFTTGVAVVTSIDGQGKPIGLTVNSFNSVSLDPPLVLWSIALTSPNRSNIVRHGAFAVNILSDGQRALCMRFARPAPDKFAGVRFETGYKGIPLLADALAQLECDVYKCVEAGDHEIIIGRVVDLRAFDGAPLAYHRSRFVEISDET